MGWQTRKGGITHKTVDDKGLPPVRRSMSQMGISHMDARANAILSCGGMQTAGVVPFGKELRIGGLV